MTDAVLYHAQQGLAPGSQTPALAALSSFSLRPQ